MNEDAIAKLADKGIKPTANRILVMKALLESETALSIYDLQESIGSLDKSSIFRVLNLFLSQHAVHGVYDGSGSMKYEVCRSHGKCENTDMHVHFYCRSCHRTFCMKSLSVPSVDIPSNFTAEYSNFTIVGLCDACQEQ